MPRRRMWASAVTSPRSRTGRGGHWGGLERPGDFRAVAGEVPGLEQGVDLGHRRRPPRRPEWESRHQAGATPPSGLRQACARPTPKRPRTRAGARVSGPVEAGPERPDRYGHPGRRPARRRARRWTLPWTRGSGRDRRGQGSGEFRAFSRPVAPFQAAAPPPSRASCAGPRRSPCHGHGIRAGWAHGSPRRGRRGASRDEVFDESVRKHGIRRPGAPIAAASPTHSAPLTSASRVETSPMASRESTASRIASTRAGPKRRPAFRRNLA